MNKLVGVHGLKVRGCLDCKKSIPVKNTVATF